MLAIAFRKLSKLKCSRSLMQVCTQSRTKKAFLTTQGYPSLNFDNIHGKIDIAWGDGDHSCVPYEFLRDNCQCPSCFYGPATQSLTLLPEVLTEAGEGIRDAIVEGDEVAIYWNCGHVSKFKSVWLKERVYTDKKLGDSPFDIVLWGSEHKDNLKLFEFEKVVTDDAHLLKWMKVLATEGINVLKHAPRAPGQLKILAKRGFGSLYNTMYGDVFTVKDKPAGNNLAYTSGYLALHTDQPYYYYQPGIQFLHCIVGSKKNQGVSQLVDGFKVATCLREHYPETFKILTTLKFPYEQRGNDIFGSFILQADQSPIEVDENGKIVRISHNYPSRGAFMNMPADETKMLYHETGVFQKMMYDPVYLVEYQLKEGDILCFHNKRVLHGRTPYDSSTSKRWLEGAYASWDDLYARMRAVQEQLPKTGLA